ncbi:MAG: DUF6864 domain-containing function [Flavobacterium sp.]|jgi:hypothetical protein|uniref:DUF6864 domain-containing function n=1 Tax=Flavobacterium sp. TaxID=239 RepID=UPI003BC80DE9
MKITSGEYELLYSGTVIGINDEDISFEFPPEKASLKTIISFKTNTSEKNSSINFELIDNKTLKIILINAESSLGTGNTNVLDIGNIDDKTLFFNYRIYSIKNISKTIHYTFYLRKEEKNGK